MNKLCPYFQKPGRGEDVLDAWCPPAALFMDIDGDFIARIRQKYPGMKIVVRMYEEEGQGWRKIAPEDWAARFLGRFAGHNPDFVVNWTMPLSQDDRHLFADFDWWQMRFAHAIRQYTDGIEPIGCCFSTGNFTGVEDRIKLPDAFPQTCQVYDFLGPQDYSWPDLWDGLYYYALRWTKWHDDIKASTGREMKFIVMECGLTQAVIEGRPDQGWQSGADGVTDESYLDSMRWYNGQLCQIPYVEHAFVYLFHGYGDWATFDHIKRPAVWQAIRDFEAETAPPEQPPEPEPNRGEQMKIYDRDGNERDAAWLVKNYGKVVVHPIEGRISLKPGDRVYRVITFLEKTGVTNATVNVVGADGNPVHQETVAFTWPDAPEHGRTGPAVWTDRAVFGDTGLNGDIGFGMGTGAYYSPPDGGPHTVWVWDLPSDHVTGIGMKAGTFHDHVDVVYQEHVWGAEPPAPPEQPPGGIAAELRNMGQRLIAISDLVAEGGEEAEEIALFFRNGRERRYALTPKAAGALSGLRALAGRLAAKLGFG